jgi:cytoskeleton protein RodZ
MNEGENVPAPPASPRTVGERLRAGREAQGLSLADVAARTRVTQRFLEAIENDRLDQLPSPAYASGFARAYARAVGLDQAAIGHDVRAELARGAMPARQHHIEEIADPARAPSRTTVIVAAGLALAVLVLGVLWLASGMLRGTGEAPAPASTVAAMPAATQPVASPAPAAGGQVTLTATDEVWMRVYDAANETLFLGTMKPGQRFEVPANANQPMINVGRPDQLEVTLNGSKVAPLGDGRRAIKDVRISAAALAARASAAGEAEAQDAPAPRAAAPVARASVPRAFASPAPRRAAREGDDETRRANAAPDPAPAATNVSPPGVATAP